METTVVLSRKMGDYAITQRTSDGYFDGNALLHQWNMDEKNTRRRLDDFLDYKSTKEFIEEIAKNQRGNIANGDNQIVMKQKGRMTINGKTKDKVWMHPFLFIDFAMWINPTFKVTVIKFVYDELIKFRNEAGDAYKELASAIVKITPKKEIPTAMTDVAQALNYVVLNRHEREVRNRMDEKQMREMVRLEQDVTLLINEGLLTSLDSTINYLRKKWNAKYRPQLFAQ